MQWFGRLLSAYCVEPGGGSVGALLSMADAWAEAVAVACQQLAAVDRGGLRASARHVATWRRVFADDEALSSPREGEQAADEAEDQASHQQPHRQALISPRGQQAAQLPPVDLQPVMRQADVPSTERRQDRIVVDGIRQPAERLLGVALVADDEPGAGWECRFA